jgi:hypothetical protein
MSQESSPKDLGIWLVDGRNTPARRFVTLTIAGCAAWYWQYLQSKTERGKKKEGHDSHESGPSWHASIPYIVSGLFLGALPQLACVCANVGSLNAPGVFLCVSPPVAVNACFCMQCSSRGGIALAILWCSVPAIFFPACQYKILSSHCQPFRMEHAVSRHGEELRNSVGSMVFFISNRQRR